MALLSIVLVTHREQGFLRRCLTSVLSQAPDDLEVVVVDDAAADHSGEIAAEVAAGDPRVRVLDLPRRHGPGPALAAALDQVSGEYVWVVQPTDLVADQALEPVLRELAASAPDVLVVGHVVRNVLGRERAAHRYPDRLGPQLWDKVVRTSLLRSHLHAPGDDAGWEVSSAWSVARAAQSVQVLDRPSYVRRDLPRAVRARSAVGNPAQVVDAYDRILAEPADEPARTVALTWFTEAALPLLDDVAPRDRAEVFSRLSGAWRAHADELAPLARLNPARRKALQSGSFRTWQLAGEAGTVRRRARKAPRSTLRSIRHPRRQLRSLHDLPLRTWYRLQLRAPLDPDLVVYAAYWYRGYSCNPRAVFEKARELVPRLRGVWVVEADQVAGLPEGVDHVVPGTRDYYRLMARATYFVNNVNFPNDIVKRPGQVHLQTHHGTPLKTMGMDLVDSTYTERRMNFPRLLKRVARWDYSVSQNVFSSEQWEAVYPSGTYQSIETGYPRNDVLATAGAADVERARAALGITPGQTTVLYLPTHREYHPGYVPQLDPAALARSLGPDHLLLMRTHYFYRGDSAAAAPEHQRVVDVADSPRIEDLYLAADVLVTDYSSAMFDYAVLDRPVVIYAPDWEEYRAKRGTTFDLMTGAPGPVATTEAELTEVLASRRPWDDESTARRRAFRERFCSLEDGGASERVVSIVWPGSSGGKQ